MSNIGKKKLFLSSTIQINTFKNFLIIKGVFGVVKINIKIPLAIKYNDYSLCLALKKKSYSCLNKNFKHISTLFSTKRC